MSDSFSKTSPTPAIRPPGLDRAVPVGAVDPLSTLAPGGPDARQRAAAAMRLAADLAALAAADTGAPSQDWRTD